MSLIGILKNYIRSRLLYLFVSRKSFRYSFYEYVTDKISHEIIIKNTSHKHPQIFYIEHGAFRGCRFFKPDKLAKSYIHETALKITGLYEQEVLDLVASSGKYWNLISVGAADGYYAISMLKNGFVRKAFLIEIDNDKYELIRRNCVLNKIPIESCQIIGGLEDALNLVSKDDEGDYKNLVICDIEGDEYHLFCNSDLIQTLSLYKFDLVIELHDRNSDLRDNLKSQLSMYYDIKILNSNSRDFMDLEVSANRFELFGFAAENRGGNFEFIFCSPRF